MGRLQTLLQKLIVAHSRDLLDNFGQQGKAAVRVLEFLAGRKLRKLMKRQDSKHLLKGNRMLAIPGQTENIVHVALAGVGLTHVTGNKGIGQVKNAPPGGPTAGGS